MTDQPPQQAASIEELQESIDELSAYRERLYNDVLGLGKKLRLSQKKIDAALSEHPELTRIDEVLDQLKAQIKVQSGQ
jgi:predicted RNase H-like nuclease (RuvC/YqgF family)|tara:strand:- start:1216 stop:1449 length:234 start_codon:yes stop_codon:yes gene_type:complete